MKAEERFNNVLAELKQEYKRVNDQELASEFVYQKGYIRNIKNKWSTPQRISDLENWLCRLKAMPSKEEQKLIDKKARFEELDNEIKEAELKVIQLKKYKEELRAELYQDYIAN